MSERELLEAENILYKADRLSLTIIRLRIPVYETTQLRKKQWKRCLKSQSQESAKRG